jgi:hypothetical protein
MTTMEDRYLGCLILMISAYPFGFLVGMVTVL